MNQKMIDNVVNAVLYEGYILYPYRASAKKNRQQFTFGRVYPETYGAAGKGLEPAMMQTECLVEGPSSATLDVTVRFLQPMERDIGALAAQLKKLPAPNNPDFFHVVPQLEIEGQLYQSWQEAVERSVRVPALTLSTSGDLTGRRFPFSFAASRTIEPILDQSQHIAGVIVRRQEAVAGMVEVTAQPVGKKAFKITVRVVNRSAVPEAAIMDPDEIALRTFASTHTILHAEGAEFISLIDPPAAYTEASAACHNIGTWPSLVGDEKKQERDTMISSPIILSDYPKIPLQSPGDYFHAGEINEIPSPRIKNGHDAEKKPHLALVLEDE